MFFWGGTPSSRTPLHALMPRTVQTVLKHPLAPPRHRDCVLAKIDQTCILVLLYYRITVCRAAMPPPAEVLRTYASNGIPLSLQVHTTEYGTIVVVLPLFSLSSPFLSVFPWKPSIMRTEEEEKEDEGGKEGRKGPPSSTAAAPARCYSFFYSNDGEGEGEGRRNLCRNTRSGWKERYVRYVRDRK